MTKISDELRRQANCIRSLNSKTHTYKDPCKIERLADRIDDEMAELPRDANDKPIHVGDTVYDNDGRKYHVRGVTIGEMLEASRYVIHATSVMNVCLLLKPECLTHARPDSWECIADELEEWSEDNRVNGDSEVFDRAADYADRIRKLAKREDKR